MNLKSINKKRESVKQDNIELVTEILKENPQCTEKQIKEQLETTFGVRISVRTIRRYKSQIPKELKIHKPKKKTPKTTPKEESYPYFVRCPKCKTKMQITSNPVQSVACYRCGYEYDRKNKKWVSLKKHSVCPKSYDWDDFA